MVDGIILTLSKNFVLVVGTVVKLFYPLKSCLLFFEPFYCIEMSVSQDFYCF